MPDMCRCETEPCISPPPHPAREPLKAAAVITAIAIVYFVASKIGFMMAFTAEQVTLVWPPTGIAIAAILRLGYRVWPAIALGAFLANITTNEPVLVALGIALGNTLEAVSGVWMLHRFVAPDININRMKDATGLFFFSAILCTAVSTTIGVASLCLGGLQSWTDFNSLWFIWWLGDASGAFIIVPAILVWTSRDYYYSWCRAPMIEAALLAAGLIFFCIRTLINLPILGIPASAFVYFIFLFIIWAAIRFGHRGTTLVTLISSSIAIWATLQGFGPFVSETTTQSLMLLNIFMAVVAATGMCLSAAMAERRDVEKQLQDSNTKIKLIIDNALDAIVSIDQNGLVTEWSKQAEMMFGWTRQEVMGNMMSEIIIPPAYREHHRRGMERFLKEGYSKILNARTELEAITRNGEIFPVELTVTTQKINGQYFFTSFIRDISLTRQAANVKGLLAAIVESSGDAIISKTLDGMISYWNTAAERLFGYTAAEAVNKHISLIIPQDRRDEEHSIVSKLLEGKPVMNFETVRISKSGRLIDISITESPIRDPYGKIIGTSKTVRDITERKEAYKKIQAAHQYLDDVLNHIPDPIFMKDREHHWIGGNKAFWELMDGPPEKFIGKSDYDVFPKEEADHFWEIDNKVLNSKEVDISEDFFTNSKGERRVLSTKKANFLNENGEQFLVGVIRDITYVKNAEIQLVKYTEELKRSNQDLDDFAYVASHDLKEPLRGLTILTSMLLEDYKSKLDAEGIRQLQRLTLLSQRMNQLVADLLYYSRLGRAKLAVQEVDPNEIIYEIQKMIETLIKEKNARIIVPNPMPNIVCDKPGVTEVFRNLITNALQYNDKDEKTVEVGMLKSVNAPHGPEKNAFYVKDNGIGIQSQFHQAIFQIFKRLPTSARFDENGTGVGLTFVKKIIERNHGRIWLESVPGEGTTFYFTIQ